MNTQRPFYNSPEPNRLMRLLWAAAGGDEYILRRSTYADQVKYMCLGGILLATGLMASLAGGYAFYTIFAPKGSAIDASLDTTTVLLSVAFGIFWGLMIFNLDRFIVSSSGTGDGTEAITRKEFSSAVPRLILGAIIAITISKPVEIRMFKTEIDVALHEAQMERKQEYLATINERYADRIGDQRTDIEKWEAEMATRRNRITEIQDQYISEARNVRPGPRAAALKVQLDAAQAAAAVEDEQAAGLIAAARQQIAAYETEKSQSIRDADKVAAGLDGLLERIKLAHEIAGWWITGFVMLLFLAIELTPILFKLMLIRSPYDFMKKNIEEQIKAQAGILVKRGYHQDEGGQEHDVVTFVNKDKMALEQEGWLDKQKELNAYALEQYMALKKAEIDADPEAYLRKQQTTGQAATATEAATPTTSTTVASEAVHELS